MTNRHIQPGTFMALLILGGACATIGWGLGDAILADIHADRNADRTAVPAVPIVVTADPVDPFTITVADCGADTGMYPCTHVEALSWVLVWPEGNTTRIPPCPREDGGPVLPCVWTDPVPGGFLLYADRLDVGVAR